MVLVVIPSSQARLWITLFLTSLALAVCLPSCATLLRCQSTSGSGARPWG